MFFYERVSDGKERSGSLASKPIPQGAPGIMARRRRPPPRSCLLSPHSPGGGAHVDSWPRDKPFPVELLAYRQRSSWFLERERGWLARLWPRANRPQRGCASSLVSSSPDPAPLWSPGPSVRSSVSILCHLCSRLLPSSLLTGSLPFDTPPPHPKPLIPSYL